MAETKNRIAAALAFPFNKTIMDGILKDVLDQCIADKKRWNTVSIPFPTQNGEVNLCDYIGFDCRLLGECFVFPDQYNSSSKETRARLAKALKIAAAEGKFPLVEQGWDEKKKQIRFECFRSQSHSERTYQKRQGTSFPREDANACSTSSKRPDKGKECPFHFYLYWVQEERHWCLFGGTRGNCNSHSHHLPMEPHEVKKSIAYINGHKVQIALDAATSSAPPSVIGKMLQLQTGNILLDSSLQHIRMRLGKEQETVLLKDEEFMMQADKLLSYLENTPEISFCAIYNDPDSPLFTVYKQRAKKDHRRLHTSIRVNSGVSAVSRYTPLYTVGQNAVRNRGW
jgi:hypothetical protein